MALSEFALAMCGLVFFLAAAWRATRRHELPRRFVCTRCGRRYRSIESSARASSEFCGKVCEQQHGR